MKLRSAWLNNEMNNKIADDGLTRSHLDAEIRNKVWISH